MKLTVTKSALINGLSAVQNVVGSRSTLPILANVLLAADKDKLWLTTTNLDVSVRCGIEANVSRAGATTLPVRRLSGIVRELNEGEIEIDIDDNDVATLTSGSSYFKIIGISEEEFPPVPKPEGEYGYKMEQGIFKEMIRKTAYAASTDETRYVLNGVLLSFRGGKLTVVATDGRRLALVEHEVEVPRETEADIILPSKAVSELLHTLHDQGELRIYAKGTQVMFHFGDVQIVSKLIEGTYPNYRQVIPAQCEERVTLERESLLAALRRVALLSTDKTMATKLMFGKNKLVILMTTPDIGEARETLPIKYAGRDLTVAFNPDFMMDPLKNLTTDEVFIEMTDEMSPGVIKCDMPFLYVLMPMRIG